MAIIDFLKSAYDKSEFSSTRQLAAKAGFSNENYVSNTFQRKSGTISAEAFLTLCSVLEVDPRKAMPEQFQATPDIGEMLSLYHQFGGQLSAFTQHEKYYDLYDIPDGTNSKIRAVHIGSESMLGLRFREFSRGSSTFLSAFMVIVNSPLYQKTLSAVLDDFQKAGNDGITLSIQSLDEPHFFKKTRIKLDYVRLLMRVHDGNEFKLLNYCRNIS